MKIEMGESLMYSWMKHVKGCKIVQTNWKTSPAWDRQNDSELTEYMEYFKNLFQKDFDVFKQNASLDQLVNQGECDVLGVDLSVDETKVYAADIAYHSKGLNYKDTVQKVTEKYIRTAFCIYAYTGIKEAEIIFASPLIRKKNFEGIIRCMDKLQDAFDSFGFAYTFRLIANDDFREIILDPVIDVSYSVNDMGELFMRSYQLLNMFYDSVCKQAKKKGCQPAMNNIPSTRSLDEFKVGKLAQVYFTKFANEGRINVEDVNNLMSAEYSKTKLGLNFPCLVLEGTTFEKTRYYSTPITINGKNYRLCSQWFETSANNDRPLLVEWINCH